MNAVQLDIIDLHGVSDIDSTLMRSYRAWAVISFRMHWRHD